jgi:hypothetical protein
LIRADAAQRRSLVAIDRTAILTHRPLPSADRTPRRTFLRKIRRHG